MTLKLKITIKISELLQQTHHNWHSPPKLTDAASKYPQYLVAIPLQRGQSTDFQGLALSRANAVGAA